VTWNTRTPQEHHLASRGLSCCSQCRYKLWQNGDFLRPVFTASRVPHISDMHSKFALRPHHVWKYGRHPISGR